MENEIETAPVPSTSGSQPPASTVSRPLSPIDAILGGSVDDRPLFSVNGKMDGLLIALAKVLKLLTKDKVSNVERKRAFQALDQISTEDIKKAVDHASMKTIQELTSFEDITVHKIKAPEIHENAVDYISPTASKDFATRINGGYFASVQKHTVKMKDLLQATADVVSYYKISPKGALNLLRRCLRDPARQLMENLVDSGASLQNLFDSLQDHYHASLSCAEASQKLRTLLNVPISNLDDFLSDLLNLSIASVKDLPASEQNKSGFILATGYLTQYMHKHYPHLSSILKHDFKTIQSAQAGQDPSATFLGMMRVLRLHRDAIEAASRRTHKNAINAIEDFGLTPFIQDIDVTSMVSQPPPKQQSDSIREIVREEIKQRGPDLTPKQEKSNESGQMKAMLQEVLQECLLKNQAELTSQAVGPNSHFGMTYPGVVQEVNNQNWQKPQQPANRNGPEMGQPSPLAPRWPPQMMQRPGQMGNYRPQMGQAPPGQRPYGGNNPNRMPLGNPANNMGLRRNFVPDEVYAKHFSLGNCFICSMQGHSYRQCPIFGPGHTVTSTACPDCESHGIKAFHQNCHGKNYRAHQNMMRNRDPPNQMNNQNQVNQIDVSQFYPEEGIPFLPGEPLFLQQNFPMYVPDTTEHSKN